MKTSLKNQQPATSVLPPSKAYPDLFRKVHELRLFPDAKAMSDVIPKKDSSTINERFNHLNIRDKDSLMSFINEHFELPGTKDSNFKSDTTKSVSQHISRLWDVLKREKDPIIEGSSLVPLPNPYIVPGGRFNEIYYWDSYFTMLGLKESGRVDMIESMIDNFAYQIDLFGHIPNGNRTYFRSRSQPPFFALMAELLAELKGDQILVKYLSHLVEEHSFWMHGSSKINSSQPLVDRLALLPKGGILNRYWDDLDTPRDEMYPDDVDLANDSHRNHGDLFRNLRAACESGWDFSARWLDDPMDLSSIHAASIVPIDLNCLLYQLEKTIARGYDQKGDLEKNEIYSKIALQRESNILSTFWNEEKGFFFDYQMHHHKKSSIHSLAASFPLFFQIASDQQAEKTAHVIEDQFLKPGGLVSTTIRSGQQWDAPNGWAPLQYITIKGLHNYGYHDLAHEITKRWLALNETVFKSTGKMMEKYNVEDLGLDAGGGEYPVQDGFGWTNGVYLALKNSFEE